jgi:hypothetical protein
VNGLKKGYQPRSNLVKDDKGDFFYRFLQYFKGWKNYFCHLLTVHGINDVRQTEMNTADPLEPVPTRLMSLLGS